MGALLAHLVRKVAEGDFGQWPKVVYWKLAGWKTWIGLGLAVLWFSLTQAGAAGVCAQCDGYAASVLAASVFMVSVGLGDAFIRARPPYKD